MSDEPDQAPRLCPACGGLIRLSARAKFCCGDCRDRTNNARKSAARQGRRG